MSDLNAGMAGYIYCLMFFNCMDRCLLHVMTTKPSPVGFRCCNAVRPRSAHERQRHPFAVLPLAPAPQAHDRRAVPLVGPSEHPCPLAAVRTSSRQHKPAGDWWRVNVYRGHNPALKRDRPQAAGPLNSTLEIMAAKTPPQHHQADRCASIHRASPLPP